MKIFLQVIENQNQTQSREDLCLTNTSLWVKMVCSYRRRRTPNMMGRWDWKIRGNNQVGCCSPAMSHLLPGPRQWCSPKGNCPFITWPFTQPQVRHTRAWMNSWRRGQTMRIVSGVSFRNLWLTRYQSHPLTLAVIGLQGTHLQALEMLLW